jgi:hypothetical protein
LNTGGDAATFTDRAVGGAVICSETADPEVGSACNLTTTLSALQPGWSREANIRSGRLTTSFGALQVLDGTSTGTPGANSQLFEREGLFVP